MKIFITDGSVTSFFTAVFDAYTEKECLITSDRQVQLTLDSEIIAVSSDSQKCDRVRRGISKYDMHAEEEVSLALRCCDKRREQIAFEYIKILIKAKAPVRSRLNLTEVLQFKDIMHKVTDETHKLTGFLRFMECDGGVLYAPYSPDNNITDLLMRHFAARLRAEKFIIHDIKRKIAGIYNGETWTLCYADRAEICLSENEKSFENLWKKYYKAVNIAERPHEKQMKGYMPVRYWKFLPEKRED